MNAPVASTHRLYLSLMVIDPPVVQPPGLEFCDHPFASRALKNLNAI